MAKQSVLPEVVFKLSFFFLGVAAGMFIFWIALMWVPGAVQQALSSL